MIATQSMLLASLERMEITSADKLEGAVGFAFGSIAALAVDDAEWGSRAFSRSATEADPILWAELLFL